MITDKVRPHHLERKALLYVRQSSAHQVLHNRESSALQYAMRDRLTALGWLEIEVIDDDLGRSAAGGVQRAGFERMVAEVCLGKVGAVCAREVSRFARNSRDWQQLIEMCRVVDTVLVDQETMRERPVPARLQFARDEPVGWIGSIVLPEGAVGGVARRFEVAAEGLAHLIDARLKKRIVRTIIHEVVADIDDAAAEIVLVVHWIGGVHSEMRLPRRRRGQRNSTSADVITAVCQLVLIANDDVIAGILNRNGLKTGNGNRWTRERVTSMRSNYRIPVFKPAEDGIEPWLNLSNAAKLLQIAPKTLRLAAEAGEIEAIHPLPEGPSIFARAALTTSAARSITERARQNPRYPAGSHPGQQSLFSSIT